MSVHTHNNDIWTTITNYQSTLL